MKKKVVLKDIAKKTGFTINTVSRALKDKDEIALKTRELIKRMANKMGYIPNATASALRSGKTKTVAVILPDVSNPSFGILMKNLEDILDKEDYTTFIMNTDEESGKERRAIISALGKNVDGVIICLVQKDKENFNLLKNSQTPNVLLGRYFDDKSDCVAVDDENGAFLATELLIKKGHKEILFLNGPIYITSSIKRLEGYKNALKKYNIPYLKQLVQKIDIRGGDTPKTLIKLKKNKINFSAIFSFSDLVAWEAIETLSKMGLIVPKDIAVVGFDNIQSNYNYPFPLTTIDYNKKESAQKTVDILLKKINNEYKSSKHIYLMNTSLVLRNST